MCHANSKCKESRRCPRGPSWLPRQRATPNRWQSLFWERRSTHHWDRLWAHCGSLFARRLQPATMCMLLSPNTPARPPSTLLHLSSSNHQYSPPCPHSSLPRKRNSPPHCSPSHPLYISPPLPPSLPFTASTQMAPGSRAASRLPPRCDRYPVAAMVAHPEKQSQPSFTNTWVHTVHLNFCSVKLPSKLRALKNNGVLAVELITALRTLTCSHRRGSRDTWNLEVWMFTPHFAVQKVCIETIFWYRTRMQTGADARVVLDLLKCYT